MPTSWCSSRHKRQAAWRWENARKMMNSLLQVRPFCENTVKQNHSSLWMPQIWVRGKIVRTALLHYLDYCSCKFDSPPVTKWWCQLHLSSLPARSSITGFLSRHFLWCCLRPAPMCKRESWWVLFEKIQDKMAGFWLLFLGTQNNTKAGEERRTTLGPSTDALLRHQWRRLRERLTKRLSAMI